MEELALHILDIAENSIRGGARNVEIRIEEDLENDRLTIIVRDDGAGMDETTKQRALDPFFSNWPERSDPDWPKPQSGVSPRKRVGLGLPLLADAARRAGGAIAIKSESGGGTEVVATFEHGHVDRQPLGNVAQTMATLVVGNPEVEFRLTHRKPRGEWSLDTREIKRSLGSTPINSGEGIRVIRTILGT